MVSKTKVAHYVIVTLFLAGIAYGQAATPSAKPSTATSYLNHVLDLMQQNALHTKEIDWPTVRRETLKRAEGAETTADTYPAIYYALTQLKEHHSFLSLPDNLSNPDKKRAEAALNSILGPYSQKIAKSPESPFGARSESAGHLIHVGNSTIAFVIIPHCFGRHSKWEENTADFQSFADSLHKIAANLERSHPQGWIVDVRGNGGGNMWPMLAGIGFVLGEGRLGSFVASDGTESHWSYHEGKVEIEGHLQIQVKEPPFALPSLPPVAVLIDSGTASSGEAVAISFAGRSRERSFGTHTFGLSTSNNRFPLSDGASLYLNNAYEADRLNRRYDDGIKPDVSFSEPTTMPTEDSDPVVQAAEEWLLSVKPQR